MCKISLHSLTFPSSGIRPRHGNDDANTGFGNILSNQVRFGASSKSHVKMVAGLVMEFSFQSK
jgi:hypothetical protein